MVLGKRNLLFRLCPFSPRTSCVACGRDGEGQRCNNSPCVSCTDTTVAWTGAGWRSSGTWMGHPHQDALQQSSTIWLLQGCKGEQLKLSKLNRFEMRVLLNRESSKPWKQIVTAEVSLLQLLENVNKSWVSFLNICPASSSYCKCYDWVVQILMTGRYLSPLQHPPSYNSKHSSLSLPL